MHPRFVPRLLESTASTLLLVIPAIAAGAEPLPPQGRAYTGPRSVHEGRGGMPDRLQAPPPAVPPAAVSPAEPTPRAEPAPDELSEAASQLDAVAEVRVPTRRSAQSDPYRAGSVVTRRQMDERLPRSAPDALRYEPGVYVQQTAHGQASPYVRGLTGQQTVMFFDGVRLNNSTFRQGPNQYFFTIDSRTVQRLEVLRGSASTRYGSDALGGALLSEPIEPALHGGSRRWDVHGRGILRTATADAEMGGRAQLEAVHRSARGPGRIGFLAGIGYRDVGQLRSGGRITAPATGQPQKVPPVFEADDETQKGTGFSELTADARLVWQPRRKHGFTLAYYDYRQMDAPRTDRCPPPTAPADECLTYDEQFRTLVYGKWQAEALHAAVDDLQWTVSYQRQHEDRRVDRGSLSATDLHGVDNVHTIGTRAVVSTEEFQLAPWAQLGVQYGADLYYDRIASRETIVFTDVGIENERTRGQYLDGAQYVTSGAWTEVQTHLGESIVLRGGGRFAVAHAAADGDEASSSAPVDRTWVTGVGNAGVVAFAVPWLHFLFNVDQGFRAPNLDDLTSRQQTGPGFQYENASLRPEHSLTLEAGMRVQSPWIELEVFGFQTSVDGLIQRASRTVEQCPAGEPGCGASQTRFQLVNLDGRAHIRGVDGQLRLYLPYDLGLRSTISYAWGEGPNPEAGATASQRMPLSRIPPLNGTLEAGWRSTRLGLYTVAALRWARSQTRLAPQDVADPRIPAGGTPGYVVVDLRAGYRLDPHVLLSVVFENVGDAAYRYHGSSVNGPGRGVMAEIAFGF